MRKWRTLDIFPGEWVGTDHELELEKELNIGDKAVVIVDSQLIDEWCSMNEPRRIGREGVVIDIEQYDEWAYKLDFGDGTNWFKRYHLRKSE